MNPLAILVLSLATLAGLAKAQDAPQAPKYAIGFGLGMTGGMGFSVKRWTDDKRAIQVNFIPFYREEKYPGDGGHYGRSRETGYSNLGVLSLGALYQHTLGGNGRVKIVAYGGGGYTGVFRDENFDEAWRVPVSGGGYSDTAAHVARDYTRHSPAVGGGLGGVIHVWRMEFTTMLGMRAAYDSHTGSKSLTPSLDLAAHFRL